MCENMLYINLKNCMFAASEISLLGWPDPETIEAITDWPVPADVQRLRTFRGLAAYLYKYSHNYAVMNVHLPSLLKNKENWVWSASCQRSFEDTKKNLTRQFWQLRTKARHYM